MLPRLSLLAQRLLYRRMMLRVRADADRASGADIERLRDMRGRARALRRELDRLLHVAESRTALPLSGATGVPLPPHGDWGWRPELWCGPVSPSGQAGPDSKARLGSELTLFHDCTTSEMTLRQIRNSRPEDLAPYSLALDVLGFDGSFLSLALDLPATGLSGLRRRHVVSLSCEVEAERPLRIFTRLNIRSGPNTEQMVREIPAATRHAQVDFDLGYMDFSEQRVDRGWVDLIVDAPAMNRIVLRDLTMTRRPRAAL